MRLMTLDTYKALAGTDPARLSKAEADRLEAAQKGYVRRPEQRNPEREKEESEKALPLLGAVLGAAASASPSNAADDDDENVGKSVRLVTLVGPAGTLRVSRGA